MKKILVLMVMLVVVLTAAAVPAKRNSKHVLTLADGKCVEATLMGDEHGHWYVDADGRALTLQNGVAAYLQTSELEARKARASARRQQSNARRIERMESRRVKASANGMHKAFGEPTPLSGKKKGLVILVNFKDVQFKSANNQALFDKRFNEVGYSNNSGYIGSVHDYFYDQSYGKFDLTFDVVGPITVSQNMKYYGGNDENGDDSHPAEMVIEALKLVDSQVNFKDYDWDNDGEVDQVFCIYAGQGEAAGGSDDTIWPHEYDLYSAGYWGDGTGRQRLDNVYINTYAVSCELADATNIDGIGTACHEFSHCLGYADLYDTDYSGGQGMMGWDLMDGGSYNGPFSNGEVPAPYTSFERWWAGWLTLTELNSPCTVVDMKPLTSSDEAYVIYNQGNKNEYYLLENHQGEKWDAYTGGKGMMILHVDYDKSIWQKNEPNETPSHQRMTFFPADNSYGSKKSYGDGQYGWSANATQIAGDPWPGSKNKTSFTDTSTPAATLYNANSDGRKFMGKPIEEITQSSTGLISFKFDGGKALNTPTVMQASNVSTTGFTANWSAVDEAESYTLEVAEISNESVNSFKEDFSKIDVAEDGSTDVSLKLDSYTQTSGWTGSAVYLAPKGVKLGASKKSGYIQTPIIPASADGKVNVQLIMRSYGDDTTTAYVSLVNSNNTVIGEAQACKLTNSDDTYNTTFTDITSNYKVKIATTSTKKRFYLTEVLVGAAGGDVKTISGITSTSYNVIGLEKSSYKYRVKAVSSSASSVWSNYQEVDLATGISDIENALVHDGRIYNLQGQEIKSPKAGNIYIKNGRKILCM